MFAIFKKSEAPAPGVKYPSLRKAGVAYATREEAEDSLAADPRESTETHEVRPCTGPVEDVYEDVFHYEVL